jgi:pyroglutamyl-peptidase
MCDSPLHKRILITAFEPFGGRSRNASAEALSMLTTQLTNLPQFEVITRLLPVAMGDASDQICVLLDEFQPDMLLLLGEAKRDALSLETTGYNERKFTIPDNKGQSADGAINPNSPPSHESTLPLAAMLTAIESTGVSVRYSNDPGRYLCNEVLFSALDHISRRSLPTRAAFIHVPLMPDTIPNPEDPFMPTDQVVIGLLAALQALAQYEVNSQTV